MRDGAGFVSNENESALRPLTLIDPKVIIEGLITVFAGVFCWWMVFDFPSDANARFLDEDEKLRVLRRLRADGQSSAETERLSSKYIFAA